MRRAYVILSIIFGHVLFVFLTIYQQTWVTRLMYAQQELELIKAGLISQQATLEQELYKLKNPRVATQYATNTLHMQPISLRNVYQLDMIDAS